MQVCDSNNKEKVTVKSDDTTKLTEGLIAGSKGKGKSMIKIQIEITNE